MFFRHVLEIHTVMRLGRCMLGQIHCKHCRKFASPLGPSWNSNIFMARHMNGPRDPSDKFLILTQRLHFRCVRFSRVS
jgi:hypothetical protein